MTQAPRPAPFFVGESTALDFLNSIATPRTVLYDWLETGPDLLDWMVTARLVTETEAASFRKPKARAELEDARHKIVAFRERFRGFIGDVCGRELADAAHPVIAEINTILARAPRFAQIEARAGLGTRPLALVDTHPMTGPRDLIVRLALAAAHLITEADFRYVRNCEGPTCSLYFLDISKNHKRRWCSMEVCGNRAKAAAHRKR
ncbi:MAG: hypothetical protein CML68_00800 [Rhodobacteraceae bacterium]|nr:hypothetical protein [Paracoccaceae bacterium]